MTAALKATEVSTDVEVATREDLKAAVFNALRRAGCNSFDELAAQARTGRFKSMRARLAWVAIGDLYQVDLDSEV
ncbi:MULTISPECIES: hypothetical protein [unclassified Mycobacterium]|uniref:hypothetical protein n=1 Tax=unclassified Mycobacterium TaxID=2642494 RepID=UPI001E463306|nr:MULTISPECIES: hypothetical protein [unclassified Mycobacterium]